MASDYSEKKWPPTKNPLLEHVDTWEMFLFEENRGETEVLSLWHTVSSDSLEEWKPRDLKPWTEHVKFQEM